MTGYELKRDLMANPSEGRHFIKWWRRENDFAGYELIDDFLQNLNPDSQFEGYQLLTMDEMWAELKRHASNRVWMEQHRGMPEVHWRHMGSDGHMREDHYRFSPEVLMALFEKETHGDTLC